MHEYCMDPMWVKHGAYLGNLSVRIPATIGIDPAANFMALGMGFHAFHIYVLR